VTESFPLHNSVGWAKSCLRGAHPTTHTYSFSRRIRARALLVFLPPRGVGAGFKPAPTLPNNGKRNADRRMCSMRPHHTDAAATPHPSLPRERGREGWGAARLSASHHGACGSDRTPPLNSSYALPETGYAGTGVTRSPPFQCSEFPRRPVVMPAGRISPEPPGSEGDEPPPAGTALAPPAGVTGWRPLRERD